ncbi:MAG: hypothetical protein ACOZAO_05940 [Patescibacteria group bacterium]
MWILNLIKEVQEDVRKGRARKQAVYDDVLRVLSEGPPFHAWSITEIRKKLSNPTSINDVQQALKAIMKKNPRVKSIKQTLYTYK